MRKIFVLEFITLDGVIQAPGGPKEDISGGFKPLKELGKFRMSHYVKQTSDL